jgi:hypothetical protein
MDAVTADLVTRLESLTVRMEEQEAEIRRLKALPLGASVPQRGDDDGAAANQGVEMDQDASFLSRRDLFLKGAAGLAVTALAASKAEAASSTTVVGAATAQYGLLASPGASGAPVQPTLGSTTHGVIGSNTGVTVAVMGSGVLGARNGAGLAGVLGANGSDGFGVMGTSISGVGVRGEIPGDSTANAIAVYGLNNSSFAGPGPGAGGFGVYGLSGKGHGLVGATAATGGAAVVGATNGVPGAWAAAFYGPVIVGGDFIVVGGAKSAAVPHPDGSHRQLYCVESPESWFEDFGTGELVNGRAEVSIEQGFGAVAETDQYHVFLTAYDHAHLLHVTKRTPKGFTVETDNSLAILKGLKESELSGTFSWRVVAKRKDIPGERLAVVTMPPEPILPLLEDRTMTRRDTDQRDDTTR